MQRSTSVLFVVVVAAAIALLSGCTPPRTTIVHDTQTVTLSPTAAPSSTPSETTGSTTPPQSTAPSGGVGWRGNTRTSGCSSNGGAVPSGARTVAIADVDGDGERDTLIIDDRHVEVGVLTHSGRLTMTRALSGPGPAAHSVAAAYLSDGITALLADDSRTVQLGYYVDCGIVVPNGVDGKPYTFALYGWGSYGQVSNAGVRCTALSDSGGQHTIAGIDLVKDGSRFRIRSTVVSTSDRGVTAVNGRVSTTPGAYGQDDSTTKRAKTVDCAPRVTAPSE